MFLEGGSRSGKMLRQLGCFYHAPVCILGLQVFVEQQRQVSPFDRMICEPRVIVCNSPERDRTDLSFQLSKDPKEISISISLANQQRLRGIQLTRPRIRVE